MNLDQAKALKDGDLLFHRTMRNADGTFFYAFAETAMVWVESDSHWQLLARRGPRNLVGIYKLPTCETYGVRDNTADWEPARCGCGRAVKEEIGTIDPSTGKPFYQWVIGLMCDAHRPPNWEERRAERVEDRLGCEGGSWTDGG
jgi:hypothetical protein